MFIFSCQVTARDRIF